MSKSLALSCCQY